ncbi:TPA: hypothetical protein DDX30_03835 [Candidatus Wolfebacteria bacterium]|nr:hypothetical protein [Candidatus Wolfebacteria bacterium]
MLVYIQQINQTGYEPHEEKTMNARELALVLAVLAGNGFVRVDGLYCKPICSERIVIERGDRDSGVIRCGANNGFCSAKLPDGTIWIRVNDSTASEAVQKLRAAAGTTPVLMGGFVPLSNGEYVSHGDLLRRVAHPDWEPS